MQRIQNMCAKLVLSRSKYDSVKQALFIIIIKTVINESAY